jgi:DNA-binding PadR family transcriptional regulator
MLLAILERGPRHGYSIIESLRASSGGQFDLPTGTVYPALHRLERAGLIHAHWDENGGRKRRVYELTAAGQRALSTERESWHDFSAAVTTLLTPGLQTATS